MTLSEDRLRTVLAWIVILLVGGPVTAAVLMGVLHGDSPCILCWAQRTSMVLIGLTGLFVIRFGPKPKYLGLAVLLGSWGTFMAIRHSALHLARDVGQGFAASIFGVHTYVWAWVIHITVLAVIGVLLLFLRQIAPAEGIRDPGPVGRFATGLFIVVVAANALQAFASTGPPPFIGQGDPVRLSLNPKHWVWSMDELQPPRISLRGSWDIPVPDPSAVDPDPTHGPLANVPTLSVARWESIDAPLQGALSGLALDGATGRFLATTDEYGVYVLDAALSQALHGVVLDKGYSVDLTPLIGAAFLGGDTLAVLSTNKSYALLLPDPNADPDREWRHFLSTDGTVRELGLGRFATVRARQMYVLSLAYDAEAREAITVSVPSPRHRRMVVSRFARADMMLASEFMPTLAPGLTLQAPDRGLAEYVVTGAVVSDGRLYAMSAAYSTLLVLDLRTKEVVEAYALPDVEHPVGVALRGSELLVAQRDGRIAVIERPQLVAEVPQM